LEDKERKYNQQKEHLKREHRFLQRRLESLMEGQYRVRQERSISECSTATSSTSSTSESGKYYIVNRDLPFNPPPQNNKKNQTNKCKFKTKTIFFVANDHSIISMYN
jgi:hypothetical protein